MIVWGVISAATAEAKSFGGLLAIRFFLGFVEAAYFVSISSSPLDTGADIEKSRDVCFICHLGTPGKNSALELLFYIRAPSYPERSRV